MADIELLGAVMSRTIKPEMYRYIAGEDLSALRVVRFDTDTGCVVYARPPEAASRMPLGITVTAALSGVEVVVRRDGELIDDSWGWVPGQPVLLGATGTLTQTQPPSQAIMVVVGIATDTNTICIGVMPAMVVL